MTVNSAFHSLYFNIARCYEDLDHPVKAINHYESATLINDKPSYKGPFYHGTRADLKAGDLLTAGGNSNYKPKLKMNHIYFTALINGVGLAAALAKGDGPNVFISLNRQEFLRMTQMLQTKSFRATPRGHTGNSHH